MKPNSVLKLNHVAWASAAVLAAVLLFFATHSGAKPTPQAPPPPIVEVASVEQRDVPIYGEWIGTLSGQVNADVKAQVTGYLLTRDYKEGSYVTKGQLLFEIDPRPFQAALDQAKGQLAQARSATGPGRSTGLPRPRRTSSRASSMWRSTLPSRRLMRSASRISTTRCRRIVANKAQVQAAKAAIAAAKAQIQASQAAVETATINSQFHPHRFADRRYRRYCSGAGRRSGEHQQRSADDGFDARSDQRLFHRQRTGVSRVAKAVSRFRRRNTGSCSSFWLTEPHIRTQVSSTSRIAR